MAYATTINAGSLMNPRIPNISKDQTFELVAEPQLGIKCLVCGMTSYNLNDVKNEYCGNCHQYHEIMKMDRMFKKTREKYDRSLRKWNYTNWSIKIIFGSIATAGWLINIIYGHSLVRADLTGWEYAGRFLVSLALGIGYGNLMFAYFIQPWLEYRMRKEEEKWKKQIQTI